IGASETRSADRTRPAAPRCATAPTSDAAVRDAVATGTTAMPAICATAMSGIARKLSTSPANVMREKISAPIGKRSASTAADAASIDNAARQMTIHQALAALAGIRVVTGSAGSASIVVTTGTTTRMATV